MEILRSFIRPTAYLLPQKDVLLLAFAVALTLDNELLNNELITNPLLPIS